MRCCGIVIYIDTIVRGRLDNRVSPCEPLSPVGVAVWWASPRTGSRGVVSRHACLSRVFDRPSVLSVTIAQMSLELSYDVYD